MTGDIPGGTDSAVELYPDGLVTADREGDVTALNQKAAQMLGVAAGEGAGRPLGQVLLLQDHHGRDWLSTNRPFQALGIQSGVPEQEWLLPDGSPVLVTARLLRSSPRDPMQGLTVALRSGRGRARLDRERSDLVATVAHELRSPLTGVKGFLEALLQRWDKFSDEQKRLILSSVLADSERLTRLITELLDVARIDTRRIRLDLRSVPVAEALGAVVASAAAGGSRDVELHVADRVPEVLADRDKFTQVFGNLVENALRHGDGTVRVRADPDGNGSEGPGAVRVVVEDEGDGIPEEIRQRVFAKFWTRGSGDGSGLGMYLVQGLVQAHGASVELGDRPGGGTRVSVVWPAAPPAGVA